MYTKKNSKNQKKLNNDAAQKSLRLLKERYSYLRKKFSKMKLTENDMEELEDFFLIHKKELPFIKGNTIPDHKGESIFLQFKCLILLGNFYSLLNTIEAIDRKNSCFIDAFKILITNYLNTEIKEGPSKIATVIKGSFKNLNELDFKKDFIFQEEVFLFLQKVLTKQILPEIIELDNKILPEEDKLYYAQQLLILFFTKGGDCHYRFCFMHSYLKLSSYLPYSEKESINQKAIFDLYSLEKKNFKSQVLVDFYSQYNKLQKKMKNAKSNEDKIKFLEIQFMKTDLLCCYGESIKKNLVIITFELLETCKNHYLKLSELFFKVDMKALYQDLPHYNTLFNIIKNLPTLTHILIVSIEQLQFLLMEQKKLELPEDFKLSQKNLVDVLLLEEVILITVLKMGNYWNNLVKEKSAHIDFTNFQSKYIKVKEKINPLLSSEEKKIREQKELDHQNEKKLLNLPSRKKNKFKKNKSIEIKINDQMVLCEGEDLNASETSSEEVTKPIIEAKNDLEKMDYDLNLMADELLSCATKTCNLLRKRLDVNSPMQLDEREQILSFINYLMSNHHQLFNNCQKLFDGYKNQKHIEKGMIWSEQILKKHIENIYNHIQTISLHLNAIYKKNLRSKKEKILQLGHDIAKEAGLVFDEKRIYELGKKKFKEIGKQKQALGWGLSCFSTERDFLVHQISSLNSFSNLIKNFSNNSPLSKKKSSLQLNGFFNQKMAFSDSLSQIQWLESLSKEHKKFGNNARFLVHCDEALANFKAKKHPHFEARAWYMKGQHLEKLWKLSQGKDQLSEAIDCYSAALNLFLHPCVSSEDLTIDINQLKEKIDQLEKMVETTELSIVYTQVPSKC